MVNTIALKAALLAKMNELRSNQAGKDEIAIERNADLMDEIQHAFHRELRLASLSRDWKTQALVSEALQRLQRGEFGVCSSCDEPISERRLQVIPWAKYCVRCQEIEDQRTEEETYLKAA